MAHTAGHGAQASSASPSHAFAGYVPIENEREGLSAVPDCIRTGRSAAPTRIQVYFNGMRLPTPELIAGWPPASQAEASERLASEILWTSSSLSWGTSGGQKWCPWP